MGDMVVNKQQKQKPVWRMNTGQGVPSDLGDYVAHFGGSFCNGRVSIFETSKPMTFHDDHWSLDDSIPVIAYQTNRTKAAKYERVECDCKGGVFYMPSIEGGYYDPHPCDNCNGKGYRLERTK